MVSGISRSIETEVMEASYESFEENSSKRKPIPLKIWTSCNLISNALEPLQREESLKTASEIEQESEREDTQEWSVRKRECSFTGQ